MNDPLIIAGEHFQSRLLLGTGKFASTQAMQASFVASQTNMVTMALKRVMPDHGLGPDPIMQALAKTPHIRHLPNTAGARDAKEALFAAALAREALETNWLKLEIHPDPKYLLPDPIETLKAAEQLVQDGFIVLPYCFPDPVLCKRLEAVGCAAVMPLASPIGSNQGLVAPDFLRIIVEQAQIPVIIDAGLGRPSHAAQAMELGADAVLVNTAIATAADSQQMADAFAKAVQSGRKAYLSGPAQIHYQAQASSPLTDFLK